MNHWVGHQIFWNTTVALFSMRVQKFVPIVPRIVDFHKVLMAEFGV